MTTDKVWDVIIRAPERAAVWLTVTAETPDEALEVAKKAAPEEVGAEVESWEVTERRG